MKHTKAYELSEDDARRLKEETGLGNHEGYLGVFTRRTAPGAWPADTRVVKARSEPGDTHPDGTLGTVLGSLANVEEFGPLVMYFVEWDPRPRHALAVMSTKLRAAQ